jgi:hypothetical protein
MGVNRRPWEYYLSAAPDGRKRRGRPEVKRDSEVARVINQNNLTPEGEVNRQIWRNMWYV